MQLQSQGAVFKVASWSNHKIVVKERIVKEWMISTEQRKHGSLDKLLVVWSLQSLLVEKRGGYRWDCNANSPISFEFDLRLMRQELDSSIWLLLLSPCCPLAVVSSSHWITCGLGSPRGFLAFSSGFALPHTNGVRQEKWLWPTWWHTWSIHWSTPSSERTTRCPLLTWRSWPWSHWDTVPRGNEWFPLDSSSDTHSATATVHHCPWCNPISWHNPFSQLTNGRQQQHNLVTGRCLETM